MCWTWFEVVRFRTAAGAKGRPQGKPRSFKDGKLQQNKNSWDEIKLEAGFNASLELQCCETIEIRTKHFGAGFEAGFEADLKSLKAMEIGAKQYDKEGDLFWSSKRSKNRRARMGLPSIEDQQQSTSAGSTTQGVQLVC